MADQPRNVRDADEDAKPQPGATTTKQDTPAAQTEPDAKPQPGAKPADDAPAKPAADTPEPKPTEEADNSEPKPTEEAESTPAPEAQPAEAPKPEDPRIADLQAKLAAATAQASAVVALANAGLPVSLAALVAAGSPDDIESNVEALAQAIDDAAAQKNTPAQPSLPPDADESEEDMQARARRIFA
jgi:hypothetical protein|nr:MAG TPA: protein of unknown function (DUF4355) [Caudoviricetes sp.]